MPSTSSERPTPSVPAPGSSAESAPPHGGPTAIAAAWLQSIRPYQWLKSALVIVPLAAAHRLGDVARLDMVLHAFIAFSLCASSIYLLNDLWDSAADRLHPHKRQRPIASGRLPRAWAVASVPALLALTILVARPLGAAFLGVLTFYLAMMVLYTLRLRSIVLLDALVLAAGYALRVIAGGLAVHIPPSARLLGFCIFLFFSLALVKRYAELTLLSLRDGPAAHARAYLLEDREFIVALGCSSGVLAVLVLVMYLSSGNIERLYTRSELIWLTAVLLLYWISYVWLMAHRGRMTDDPLMFAVKNPLSMALIAAMGITAWLAV